jgi:death on curing protein
MYDLLQLNGYELRADVDVQEAVILRVASGIPNRDTFTTWLSAHIVPLP